MRPNINSLPARLFRRFKHSSSPPNHAIQKAEGRRDTFAGQLTNALKRALLEWRDLEWSEEFTQGPCLTMAPCRRITIGDRQRGIREVVDLYVEVSDDFNTRIRIITSMHDGSGTSFCNDYRLLPLERPEDVTAIAETLALHLNGQRRPSLLTTKAVAEILRLLPEHDFWYRQCLYGMPGYEFELPPVVKTE